MGITKRVEDLGIVISDHKHRVLGVTETGFQKVGDHSFVIPSSSEEETAGGDLTTQPPEEEYIPPAPKRVPKQKAKVKAKPKAKTRTKTAAAPPPPPEYEEDADAGYTIEAPEEPAFINTKVKLDNVGTIPTQYAYVIIGKGCAVLGCNDLSFRPNVMEQGQDGSIRNAVEFELMPGVRYIFAGQTFRNNDGVEALFLHELPQGV